MRVRPAVAGDAEALAALAGQLGYPSSSAEVEARLRHLATHPTLHAAFVAEAPPGSVAGWLHVFVSYHLESDPFAEIGGLVVREGSRGEGVGAALIEQAERWARARDLAALRVRSNVVRERAHRFYARAGFGELKRQVVLQKRLA